MITGSVFSIFQSFQSLCMVFSDIQVSKGVMFLMCLIPSLGFSQSVFHTDSIAHHARELVRNQDLDVRERAFSYLNTHMGAYLNEYSNFQDTLSQHEGLAILELEDSSLRIVTYQLYRDTSDYAYGGWIHSPLLGSPVFLSDKSALWEAEPDLDYLELGPENWYGVLYYDMKVLKESDGALLVLLFGLDNYRFFTKRKILEVLEIRDGELRFGAPVFEMEEDLPRDYWKKRFILDYSVQAPAALRYDEDWKKIIFDHLVFMPSDIPAQRIMRVPDGTYSGFEIHEEVPKLVFIEKVFFETMDEAPGGRPSTGEKRDLFGNPID